MNKKFYIIILLLAEIFSIFFLFKFFKHENKIDITNQIISAKNSKFDSMSLLFQYPDLEIKDMKISYYFDKEDYQITTLDFIFARKNYHKEYFGGLYNALFYNNMEFSKPTLILITGEAQTIYTYMLEFDVFNNTINEIKFVDKDKSVSDSMCCNFMLLIPKNNGIQYDIGMPDFSYKIPKIEKYEYDQEKHTFIEK